MAEPSVREAEVLELVGSHLSNRQIAERLYLSVRTVESHVASLIRKLGVVDRHGLVTYFAEHNVGASSVPGGRGRRNLPHSRLSFVGRKAEREQLDRLVVREPLVTLTGIGGCGKTRLAVEVASDLLGAFDHGVFFVDLSAVTDATLVGQSVAGALGLQIVDPTLDALADYFQDRETLLVVDNCEHLLDACADLADALAGQRCPGVRILATSREPLGVDGERVFRVPSLDIEGEAVALFGARALSARPDLVLDSRNQATIAEICRRLDGIPLAIELAASQAVHLSLAEILERLNDRFRLLVGGRRRIQRQQTLTAALDWSYDLLGSDEQLLLGRLAVFRGSFSLSAAEAICHPGAMELLRSLVVKSMVSLSDHGDLRDGGDVVRYRLLESVRIYAEQKLAQTGESQQLRTAHRDYYLEWIESLPLEQVRHHRGGATSPVVTEADNLTAALEWCRQEGRHDLCARIAVRVAGYWFAFVRLSEMVTWGRELEASLPAEDRDHRAMALLLRSEAAWQAGEWEEFNAYGAQASELADPHTWISAEAQYLQAMYWSMIDPPRSDRLFERVIEFDASIGMSPDPLLYFAICVSRLQRATGRDEALAILDDWRADLGDSVLAPATAGVFALYGDTQTALELQSRTPPAGVPLAQLNAELSDAVLASAQRQFAKAEQHLSTLASGIRDRAVPRGEAICLIGFAKVALDQGDYARASRLLATIDSSVGPADRPFLSSMDSLVYIHCKGILGEVLDPETARTAQAEGAALSIKDALYAELSKPGGGKQ